ncbi:MAG: putative coiled-coil protein SlyX [Lentimonas sp.]|jgi:uncharacterized coiled-coil protein SlyX
MSDSESIEVLQFKLTHLEKHIAEQDGEIYQLSKRVDQLAKLLQAQRLQLESLNRGGHGGDMPADEKPPHY